VARKQLAMRYSGANLARIVFPSFGGLNKNGKTKRRKNMKRKFFSAILAVSAFTFTAGFIGCSDDKGDDPPSVLFACEENTGTFRTECWEIYRASSAELNEWRAECAEYGTPKVKCSELFEIECPFGNGIGKYFYYYSATCD
jgi:hypothetical protein